jgi:hypothetical protein
MFKACLRVVPILLDILSHKLSDIHIDFIYILQERIFENRMMKIGNAKRYANKMIIA